jgi:uncharacterized lipoprotein
MLCVASLSTLLKQISDTRHPKHKVPQDVINASQQDLYSLKQAETQTEAFFNPTSAAISLSEVLIFGP